MSISNHIFFTAISNAPIRVLEEIGRSNGQDPLLKQFVQASGNYLNNLTRHKEVFKNSEDLIGFDQDVLQEIIPRADFNSMQKLISLPLQPAQDIKNTTEIFNSLDMIMRIGNDVQDKITNPPDDIDVSLYSRVSTHVQALQANLKTMLEHLSLIEDLKILAFKLAERWRIALEEIK